MHQALYRKYRPRVFDDVCGEDHVTSVLKFESENSRFSHAYLFCGPRGTGKTTCAKILAKALNCESPEGGNPCGKCSACRSIDDMNAPDVLEMDAASNNGVDYIREIRDEVNYLPAALKKRVYIIDEVHMLSVSAFNALLKTLEEPPEHVVFILATTEFHKLPATIVSRCQRFDFRRIKAEVIASRLSVIAKEEDILLEDHAALVIAKQAQGGMRDAISMFELCSAGGHDVDSERVSSVLGLTGIEILYKTAVAVSKKDIGTVFKYIGTVDSSSKDISVFWSELIGFWRNMLVVKYLPETEVLDYLDMTEPELRLLTDASKRFRRDTITYHFSLMDEALKEMARLPATKRLIAELTLIKMSDPTLTDTSSSLLSRISALEEKVCLLELSPRAPGVQSESAETENLPEVKTDELPEAESEYVTEEDESEPQPSNGPDFTPVLELGDVIERVKSQNPLCGGFLNQCDCFISNDGKKLVVKTPNDFAKQLLSADVAMQSMRSAFVLCGIASPETDITVELGALPKKKPAPLELDEL